MILKNFIFLECSWGVSGVAKSRIVSLTKTMLLHALSDGTRTNSSFTYEDFSKRGKLLIKKVDVASL
jgi:hypothetical protein